MDRNHAEQLEHEITDALRRVVTGTATRDDARLLCGACGINPADVGIAVQQPRRVLVTANHEDF